MSDIQSFRDAIEAFIATRGWTPTRFGRQMAGDPLFVFDLREGREPRSDTRTRILKAMQDQAEAPAAPPLRIGVAGLGNVGATLVRILQKDRSELQRKIGRSIVVTAVAARSRSRDRGIDTSNVEWFDDAVALAKSDNIDLFVELIGGEDGPAYAAVRAALEMGRPVVTANKALLARHGVALARLAEENNVQLGFEAAVAGGIPVIKTLREGLGSARIERVYGIMNGTCNYILTRMSGDGGNSQGSSFAEALKEAQELGYAEADPTLRRRRLRYGAQARHPHLALLWLRDRHRRGLRRGHHQHHPGRHQGRERSRLQDQAARRRPRSADGIEQRVHPTLVPKTSAIAGVDGVLNAVALETDHVHELMLAGPGAGGQPTAASVLSDILDIARGTRVPPLGVPSQELTPYHPGADEGA